MKIVSGTLDLGGIKRLHLYEGGSASGVVRFGNEKAVVIVSAVGALNSEYQVGDIVVLSDMITLFCPSPLEGATFQDLSAVFDKDLQEKAIDYLVKNGIPHRAGAVHVFCRGPHYETPADKIALQYLGADVVGMSMTPEVILAAHKGIAVLGLCVVTNLAFVKHDHEDVKAQAEKAIPIIQDLVKQL